MKQYFFLLLSFCLPVFLQAATIASQRGTVETGEQWILANKHLKVVIGAKGGIVLHLTDKKSGKDFVGKEGAFRDQFAPRSVEFSKAEYRGKIISSRQNEVILELTSPHIDGMFQFTKITKRYTLRENEMLLRAEVEIYNQTESMQEQSFEYWSNSFWGVEGEDNYLELPCAGGILRELSGSKHFHKEPIRGWVASTTKSKSGIVLLPEYKKFKLAYSWPCLGRFKRNTLEFRLVEELLPAGKTSRSTFASGVIRNLDSLNGAGYAGCGKLTAKNNQLTAELQGFSDKSVQLVLFVDRNKKASKKAVLKAGNITKVSFPLSSGTEVVVKVLDATGKNLLFDLILPLGKGVNFKALEARNQPPEDKDPWHFEPSAEYKTPHCKWLENKPFDVLFLVEANGIRDVIELRQRMNFNLTAPTIFPRSWGMSWRKKVAFAPGSGGNSGTQHLMPFMKKKYDVIVIGSGREKIRSNKKNLICSSWIAYPDKVRKEILKQVKNGTGLLLVNPQDSDTQLDSILKTLTSGEKLFNNSMSFVSAPHFPQAVIKTGKYGKGRVAVIRYKTGSFLAPLLNWRQKNFQYLLCDHRFQEYQFAILARLINWTKGNAPAITNLSAKSGKLHIETTVAGKYDFELFNRYTESYSRFSKELAKGKTTLNVPQLQNGKNYLHISLKGKDFAFLQIEGKNQAAIKKINLKKSYSAKEKVSAGVTTSGNPAGTKLKLSVIDNTGRLLSQSNNSKLVWDTKNALVNRHVLRAELWKNNKLLEVKKETFFLPEIFDMSKEFSNLVWVGADLFPEYTYPYRYDSLQKFGFTVLFGGSLNSTSNILLQYANTETAMNGYAGGKGFFFRSHDKALQKWYKSGKKEHLVRQPCFNSPEFKTAPERNHLPYIPFTSRNIALLGDEMSMTTYQKPIDFCFCKYCLAGFRTWLKQQGWTLEKLNKVWMTNYSSWDKVMPQTYNEMLFEKSPAGFVAHRLYMDKVFADALLKIRKEIRKKYPRAMAGPTGVVNTPHTYGGNWNFSSMSAFDTATYYGTPRIPLSFNRDNRLIMKHYGYSNLEGEFRQTLWDGLFAGERGTNTWTGQIFLRPDLKLTPVRKYYSDLLHHLKNGPGDLLFHAKKYTSQAAILHSQVSVIANFMKPAKGDYPEKELSFARVLEDLGVGYRFVAPEELNTEFLKKFKVLILPEVSAIKDSDIALIKEFLRNGGKVIADWDIASLDENCNPRAIPALNEIFGIKTGRQVFRKVKSHTLDGISIDNAVTGVVCTTGVPAGSAVCKRGTAPLAIRNKNTLYLNFEPKYASRREAAFRKLIGDFLKLDSPAKYETQHAVMHSYFTNGRNLYIGLLPQAAFPGWQDADKKAAAKHSISGKLKLARKSHLYDVRAGQYLGYGKIFNVKTIPGDGTLLAALPCKISDVSVTAPAQINAGVTAVISAQVKTADGSTPETSVLSMRVFNPDNQEVPEYRQVRPAPAGKFSFRFPSSLNGKGKWKIVIRDAATGCSKTHYISVN